MISHLFKGWDGTVTFLSASRIAERVQSIFIMKKNHCSNDTKVSHKHEPTIYCRN